MHFLRFRNYKKVVNQLSNPSIKIRFRNLQSDSTAFQSTQGNRSGVKYLNRVMKHVSHTAINQPCIYLHYRFDIDTAQALLETITECCKRVCRKVFDACLRNSFEKFWRDISSSCEIKGDSYLTMIDSANVIYIKPRGNACCEHWFNSFFDSHTSFK